MHKKNNIPLIDKTDILKLFIFLNAVIQKIRAMKTTSAFLFPSSTDTSEGKAQEFLRYLPRRFYRSLTVKDLRPDPSVNKCIGDLLHLLPT